MPGYLPRVDQEAEQERLRYWRRILSELSDLDREALPVAERMNLDAFRFQLETMTAALAFRDFEMPLTSDTAFWMDCAATGRAAFKRDGDHARWIAQMRDIPRYFAGQAEQMRRGLARGFTPPRVTLEGRALAIESIATAAPEDTPYFAPFRGRAAVDLNAEAMQAISEFVQPAHARLLEFFRDEYLPGARKALGCRDLPDGDAYYRAKIREYTTLDLEPEQL